MRSKFRNGFRPNPAPKHPLMPDCDCRVFGLYPRGQPDNVLVRPAVRRVGADPLIGVEGVGKGRPLPDVRSDRFANVLQGGGQVATGAGPAVHLGRHQQYARPVATAFVAYFADQADGFGRGNEVEAGRRARYDRKVRQTYDATKASFRCGGASSTTMSASTSRTRRDHACISRACSNG